MAQLAATAAARAAVPFTLALLATASQTAAWS